MNFSDAMAILKKGSKVTREPWRGAVYFQYGNNNVVAYQPKLDHYHYDVDIMLSEGWLVEGIKKEMPFTDIVEYLNLGKKARMKDWRDGSYIFLDNQTKALLFNSMQSFPFSVGFDSFTAEDWIEL